MEDTIAAIATAYGEGGIGIVRVSGPKTFEILEQVFVPAGDGISNRKMTYGYIEDREKEQKIDEVLCVFMKAPHTYTREDVAEINCHGSMVALRKTLELVLRKGARLAEPGEFTKRAFLNGRLDLSQAEAVIDMIKAKTDKTFDVALEQLDGQLSQKVINIRQLLLDLLVNLTVNIDYPDEDIEELTYEDLEIQISQISDMVEKLLATADTGKIIREGLKVAIIGKPNVGKSSLMNELLRETRAIVTEIPGTTRDTIEEIISIRNIPIRLTDTAGIRETEDKIEKIGIEKSKKSFNEADLIIFVMDSSRDISDEDREIIQYIGGRRAIVLINKIDLGRTWKREDIEELLPNSSVLETSLLEKTGIEEIEEVILDMVYGGKVKQNESLMVTNVRHKDLLERAKSSLEDARNMTLGREALDFIEIDIKNAYESLGEIIGETVSDDIINEVFSRFCLGK
ncbi:tRNA uridine-5-carboxymethylaminomethyl(34) synthesis GTPase MnmE [Anaerovorax odorimutans]|uniref:tRNA modification GTPase MnmE n=1 Tax=Anaerovorax odorimutans TaxID=109327 RepID=A0ABT1RQL0_9FIRM|nr:tRNA uridine-5-carboxymethylaminomethyl(34) synthesis GTPase MnmE [Anaerovorax odorimutans]MCQ4637456.1 tRNA uridine-5-carboxymethylaminomethyl(34) synthesis GTPase MnmE [Anaerovorax odorimutans]